MTSGGGVTGPSDRPTLGALLARAGLAAGVDVVDGSARDREASGVYHDSRQVTPGGVFVAVRGARHDGVTFVADARARGAALIVAEPEPPSPDLPWLRVADARVALAGLAAAFHGDPSHELLVVGVTGTNGKTTTTYLIESILDRAGMSTGRMSTISNRAGRRETEQPAARTTPEAPDLQGWLRAMRRGGAAACVMEVSSHALALERVTGVRFAAGVFTNLTRDHLDFHHDMERYFAAKRRLFEQLPDGAPAIVNVDDPRGAELAASVRRPVSYAVDRPADVRPAALDLALGVTRIEVRTPRGTLQLESPLVGRTAAYNVLAAAATAVALDLPFRAIEEGVAALAGVPGRMQVVSTPRDEVTVIVDYAHTDDALRSLLEAVRPLATRRVVTVFGCGGDRDATKRPLMGAVAARLSDLVVLTSDNPRSEDPDAIIADIARGLREVETPWIAIGDRARAIERAIREAEPGDVVVVAGKGHERYQEIGPRTVPFEDAAVAADALAARRSGSRVG